MDVKTHSKTLLLPVVRRINDKKIHPRSIRSVEVIRRKFLLVLTVGTWMVAVLLSILFYIALRINPEGIDWLAFLLLGMIIFGWIMIAYYYHEVRKPVHPTAQGDQRDKQK